MADNSPFFIVGSGRSGTTLLRLILTGHSRIEIPPETWFYLSLAKELPLTESLSPAQVESAVQTIVKGYRWPDMGLDAGVFARDAHALKDPKLTDIMSLIYNHHLTRAGKARFGDKTPRYISIIPELSALYPGAKFINLIRDGHEVAISTVNAGFQTRWYHGERYPWIRAVRASQSYRNSAYASLILDVRYEDLTRNPEDVVRKICAFLGEEFEPAMLRPQDRVDTVPERERRIHSKLSKPVGSGETQNWRTVLSPLECFLMESCLYPELDRMGYSLRYAGPIWRPFLFITGAGLRALAPILDRGIPYLKRRNHLTRWRYI